MLYPTELRARALPFNYLISESSTIYRFATCSRRAPLEILVNLLCRYRQVPLLLCVVPRLVVSLHNCRGPTPSVVNAADCLLIWTDRFLRRIKKSLLSYEISIRRGQPLLRMS
jgi:hypothetical protein